MPKSADYSVVISNFADTTAFGPGTTLAVLNNPTNLAWTDYINDVGESFVSISQDDPKIKDLQGYLDQQCHYQVFRNGENVWSGWLGESDETYNDVILYAYSYLSGLYVLNTAWDVSFIGQNVDAIFTSLWTTARTAVKSRMNWMTQGTVETLATVSGVPPPILSMPLYRANYKRILLAFKELAAYAISDTTNHVMFEITPAGVFNLWRNRGVAQTDLQWRVGDGIIRSYQRYRAPVNQRNVLLGVGSSPTITNLQSTQTNTVDRDTKGRAEEPIYLQWVRDQTELDRVTKLRLTKAGRIDNNLFITFFDNVVTPFRATNASFGLGDDINIYAARGASNLSSSKIVTGQQVIYSRRRENVRVMLADSL